MGKTIRYRLQFYSKPKVAAFPNLTAEANVSAHQSCQAFANGKPQSCSSVTAQCACFNLYEFVEKSGLGMVWNPDSRILHIEPQQALRFKLFLLVNTDGNTALVGELYCVAYQIDQYLTQPERIAAQGQRDRMINI